jgi:hypothetical protein
MPSIVNPEEADPHDIFVIEPEVLNADRVGLAARVEPPFAERPAQENLGQDKAAAAPKVAAPVEDIMGDILSRPSTPKLRVVPEISVAPAAAPKPSRPVDTTFRATAATADAIAQVAKSPGEIGVPDDILLTGAKRSRGAWAKRAAFGFVFALCSAVAAEAWNHYGDTARQMLADWTPAWSLPSSQPPATTEAAAQPAAPAVETAVTDQTASPPAPAAVQPATAAAAAPPDQTQQLQTMTQDLAAMGQQVEALKASIAQLKAGQEQMAQQVQRDIVKNAVTRTSEARPSEVRPVEPRKPERPRVLGAPPRPLQPPRAAYPAAPTAAAMNVPPYPAPPPGAAPAPMPPPIDIAAPDGGPVVRPPMPLH